MISSEARASAIESSPRCAVAFQSGLSGSLSVAIALPSGQPWRGRNLNRPGSCIGKCQPRPENRPGGRAFAHRIERVAVLPGGRVNLRDDIAYEGPDRAEAA